MALEIVVVAAQIFYRHISEKYFSPLSIALRQY